MPLQPISKRIVRWKKLKKYLFQASPYGGMNRLKNGMIQGNVFSLVYLCTHEKENSGSAGHCLPPLENW
jgi:hypothetical protein